MTSQCVKADCGYFCHLGLAKDHVTVVADAATITHGAGTITINEVVPIQGQYSCTITYNKLTPTSSIFLSVTRVSYTTGMAIVWAADPLVGSFTLTIANPNTTTVLDGTTVINYWIV